MTIPQADMFPRANGGRAQLNLSALVLLRPDHRKVLRAFDQLDRAWAPVFHYRKVRLIGDAPHLIFTTPKFKPRRTQ